MEGSLWVEFDPGGSTLWCRLQAVVEWKPVDGEAEYSLEASAMLTDENSWTQVFQVSVPCLPIAPRKWLWTAFSIPSFLRGGVRHKAGFSIEDLWTGATNANTNAAPSPLNDIPHSRLRDKFCWEK